jgi:signal transduction histidine kinase
LRLTVLPAALVAAVAAAVLAYVLHGRQPVTPGDGGSGDPGIPWGVLAGGLLLTGAVVAGGALVASAWAGEQAARLAVLRRQAARGRVELQALVRKLESGERIGPPQGPPPGEPGDDPFDELRHEIAAARQAAETAVARAAALNGGGSREDERGKAVEVFVNLARRVQSFVYRQIEHLDELESDIEDPELLQGLFHIDHLATRIRRHAENLAVLGGAVPRRQWSRPVAMADVLRSCIAEVEHYARVKLVPPVEGTLRGDAVADVVHLLAELVENATEFSAPQTQVLLRAQPVTAGLAIEVDDRGLGMTAAEQDRMNAVLAGGERADVGALLADGRVGLFVVSALARRHGIAVRLQGNIYGGSQAVVVLPPELLGEEPEGRPGSQPADERAGQGAERQDDRPADRRPDAAVAPAPAAAPAPCGEAREADAQRALPRPGLRPQLPRRRRQQHLVPQLRDTAPRPSEPAAEPGGPPNPDLMAAFRRGARLADDADTSADTSADGADAPADHPPASR